MGEATGSGRAVKDDDLIFWQDEPMNIETPAAMLVEDRLTPVERFYVRSHGSLPELDAAAFRLSVSGLVRSDLELSITNLRERFTEVTVEATLACAGNRREQLAEVGVIPGEIVWGDGAIGNATWAGVRLGDVLRSAGISEEADGLHVAFEGADLPAEDDVSCYGGSIPLAKALRDEVVLAWSMNEEPLSVEHGAPLRVVVPGFIGARSVKWLQRVIVQRDPSANHFQASSYKLLPPGMGPDQIDWDLGVPLGEISTNSAICRPQEGETVACGAIQVEGWALVGGDRQVERVDVSADGGENWIQADILASEGPWSWSLWRAEIEVGSGPGELIARAWDSAANTQPENAAHLWNVKGYANNAWDRVNVNVEAA